MVDNSSAVRQIVQKVLQWFCFNCGGSPRNTSNAETAIALCRTRTSMSSSSDRRRRHGAGFSTLKRLQLIQLKIVIVSAEHNLNNIRRLMPAPARFCRSHSIPMRSTRSCTQPSVCDRQTSRSKAASRSSTSPSKAPRYASPQVERPYLPISVVAERHLSAQRGGTLRLCLRDRARPRRPRVRRGRHPWNLRQAHLLAA